ncbi:EAL domain-containing protein [Mesorhizobium sp. NBSH29]|uniref:putative bifunctional diguanylate cyclase/phosphodiesterase n=1 Tax=Mesorhizobium sp. NBSH29 TaxID=2654249 RepID=UPI0018968D2F|nr:EAL domain-containing protein [Mesorhizobium sp. NBSH29]QPC86875.1 EAL domain-containing protein [Mesorhizobium sp. NBSH29]
MTTQQSVQAGSHRLVQLFRSAYWVALAIIAAMALASYLLLQQMLATQQGDQSILALAHAQRALSQRVVFLALTTDDAVFTKKPGLLNSLKEVTTEFETNYKLLLEKATSAGEAGDVATMSPFDAVLYSRPHHLDYFTNMLAANAWRFIAAVHTELSVSGPTNGYLASRESARLDETTARATLAGYTALSDLMRDQSNARLETMLKLHKLLFLATLGIIVMVALFIFRPMANVILRRTHELVDARNSMAFIAVHDGLTGLHNRAFVTDHFDTLIKGANRREERLAVIQIDLDRFKQINDTMGHAAGDMVLVVTAQRMREACRASDLCARLGGDEFLLVLSDVGTSEDINGLTKRILAAVNQPIAYQGATINPGASAGIAVYPVDADNSADLMVHADLALYAAKKMGGSSFSFFSDELRQELENRRRLENDIKAAIAHENFSVYFQPQVSLSDSKIIGVEALARWHHAERGMISPGDFIPVAEQAGLMAQIGRIVVRKAILEAGAWHREDINFGRLAVNVSGAELRENDFAQFLFATLDEAELPADKLSLEIVESVILDDEKTGIAAKLRMFRIAGINLELDDFGTGYASLSHVNPNEIDRLKIDRRFVKNINNNSDNSKIVRAITELARGLGIAIIAEGAETEEELASLMALGCSEVQGYSIAFPMPDGEARDWLVARNPKKAKLTVVRDKRA